LEGRTDESMNAEDKWPKITEVTKGIWSCLCGVASAMLYDIPDVCRLGYIEDSLPQLRLPFALFTQEKRERA